MKAVEAQDEMIEEDRHLQSLILGHHRPVVEDHPLGPDLDPDLQIHADVDLQRLTDEAIVVVVVEEEEGAVSDDAVDHQACRIVLPPALALQHREGEYVQTLSVFLLPPDLEDPKGETQALGHDHHLYLDHVAVPAFAEESRLSRMMI